MKLLHAISRTVVSSLYMAEDFTFVSTPGWLFLVFLLVFELANHTILSFHLGI